MAFSQGKQKFTKQEIIDILKRNVSLYRDEEEFIQYVVDLAMYLVEHRLMAANESIEQIPGIPNSAIEKRTDQYTTKKRDKELYDVLKKHSTRGDVDARCRMCGAPTKGHLTCPNCGHMCSN